MDPNQKKSKLTKKIYILIGATIYPVSLVLIFVLAFLTTPLGLRSFFESLIKIIALPASYLALTITYHLVQNPLDFTIPTLILTLLFTLLIGGLIGWLVFLIKKISN